MLVLCPYLPTHHHIPYFLQQPLVSCTIFKTPDKFHCKAQKYTYMFGTHVVEQRLIVEAVSALFIVTGTKC